MENVMTAKGPAFAAAHEVEGLGRRTKMTKNRLTKKMKESLQVAIQAGLVDAELIAKKPSPKNCQATEDMESTNGNCKDDLFRKQFQKTVMCRFHFTGTCRYGTTCSFAHGMSEISTAPDLTKTSICKAWKAGFCTRPEQCPFAHGSQELRSTPLFELSGHSPHVHQKAKINAEKANKRRNSHSGLSDFSMAEPIKDSASNAYGDANVNWCQLGGQKAILMQRISATPWVADNMDVIDDNAGTFSKETRVACPVGLQFPASVQQARPAQMQEPVKPVFMNQLISTNQCEYLAKLLSQAAPDHYED